jgi:hypothetical protein
VITRIGLVFVVVGLVVAGVLYEQLDPSAATDTVASSADSLLVTPSISDPARLDGAWYCPTGSSSPGGWADHELQISNLSEDPAVAAVNILTDAGRGPTLRIDMAPQSTQQLALSTIAQADVAGAVVEIVGGDGVVGHQVTTALGTAEGPCATHVSNSWTFASGRTTRDARNYLVLMNPFPEDAVYNVEFYRSAGRPRRPADLQGGVIAAHSVAVIEVESYIAREEAVATVINTIRGRLVAERLQTLDGALGPSGAALQLGIASPAASWMLPAGRIHERGDDRVVVFNPSAEATAQIDVELWPVNPTDRSLYGLGTIPRELLPGRFEIIDLGIEANRFGLRLPYEVGVSVTSANGVPVVAERWHLAVGVDTSLIGAGGTEVAPSDDEAGEAEPAEDADGTDPPADDATDGEAEAGDAGEDASAEGAGQDQAARPPEGEFDVPGILGGRAEELAQPTADVGIATSRGTEVLSTRWVVPWVTTPGVNGAVIIVTAPGEAAVEIMALVNGVLQGPYRASVAPFGRAIVPLPLTTGGATVIVTSDTPVSVEAQVVVPGSDLDVVPGVPTVNQ